MGRANTAILTKLTHRVRRPPCGDGAQHRPVRFLGPRLRYRFGQPRARGFWRALPFSRRSDNESRCNRGRRLTARPLAKCTPGPRLPCMKQMNYPRCFAGPCCTRQIGLRAGWPRALLYVAISAGLWVSLPIGMAAKSASVHGQKLVGALVWP